MTLGDTFAEICPLAREFDGGFDGLGAGVHGEDHVVPEHVGDGLGEDTKDRIVEGAGREGEPLSLGNEGCHDLRVAVALYSKQV